MKKEIRTARELLRFSQGVPVDAVYTEDSHKYRIYGFLLEKPDQVLVVKMGTVKTSHINADEYLWVDACIWSR